MDELVISNPDNDFNLNDNVNEVPDIKDLPLPFLPVEIFLLKASIDCLKRLIGH